MKQFIVATAAFVNALGTHAIVTCNYEHQNEKHFPGEDIAKSIRPFLEGPGFDICNDLPFTNASDVLYYESPHYTFQIDRQEHTDSVGNCRSAFQSILDECIVGEKVLGGDAYVNGIGYEIYHTELREREIVGGGELGGWVDHLQGQSFGDDDDNNYYNNYDGDEDEENENKENENENEDEEDEIGDKYEDEKYTEGLDLDEDYTLHSKTSDGKYLKGSSLVARRTRGGSGRTGTRPSKPRKKPVQKPKKKPATKPSKKPIETPTKKPATKPTKTKSKRPANQPTQCPPAKKTKTGKGGKIQPRASAGKTPGGKKQPAACAREDTLNCKNILREAKAKNARENAKNKLLSRDVHVGQGLVDNLIHTLTKRTKKTGTACNEGKETFNARTYPDSNSPDIANARVFGWEYPQQCKNMAWGHTPAFRKVSSALGGQYEVEHILEWQMVTKFFDWLDEEEFGGLAQFTDPDPAQNGAQIDFCTYWKKTWTPRFTIPVNGNRLQTAKKHIAWRYPGVDFRDEFVWLQEDINAPAKQQMWTRKSTNQIYNLAAAVSSIRGTQNEAAVEAVRVKALLGAQKYHKNPLVKQYFATQVQRIRVALDQIDQALPNHPPANGHAAWQQLGLGNLWIKYMNEAFTIAKRRTDNTMDTMLNELVRTWISSAQTPKNDDFKRIIKALRTEWRKEKRSGWTRPNW